MELPEKMNAACPKLGPKLGHYLKKMNAACPKPGLVVEVAGDGLCACRRFSASGVDGFGERECNSHSSLALHFGFPQQAQLCISCR